MFRTHTLAAVWLAGVCSTVTAGEVRVAPDRVTLDRPESSQQLVVVQTLPESRVQDVTRMARILVMPPEIASVDRSGLVRPRMNGAGHVVVEYQGQRHQIPLLVERLDDPEPVSFRHELIPVLTKAGCNSGGCHGKAEGQNGFALSIFGFDPETDFQALLMESRGRRISVAQPAQSLLFRKASARTPHGGGQRIRPGSSRDGLLLRWIAEGAQFATDQETAGRIVGIEIDPSEQVLLAGESRQIRVTAIDAAGRRRCVTAEAEYESNVEAIAEVDERGLAHASDIPGEAAILVRYLGHVAACQITLPRPEVRFQRPPEANFVDTLVWDKLQRLGIKPSEPASDSEFLRRAYLDTIGTLPTAEETRRFLSDGRSDKRARLIDELLDRDEYADYWAMQWLDILRADQLKVSPQGAVAMQRWLRRSFAENRSFDALARDLLTVQGNTSDEGPGSFYKILTKPDEAARSISQLLLGVRIECAQCHHHPSERWGQGDYAGLAGFFTGLTLKGLPNGEQALISLGGKDRPHPRSGEAVAARALGAEAADFSQVSDRRRVLAQWITAPDNPFFAKAIANRLWSHYFGRGVIEPIDDIRDTNPPTNRPLMDALSAHMHEVGFDLKVFTRTLLNSRVYQLTSATNPSNEEDAQNFSHAAYRSLPAEVLLDAISQTTGVAETFNGWPDGYRAIQVWDNRMPSYFFRIFGRPVRATVCECERSNEPSIAQALHLLNAPEISEKIGHRRGRARKLASTELAPDQIIDELYLWTLARFPTDNEKALMKTAFGDGADRQAGAEDALWALLNSKEFVFNH